MGLYKPIERPSMLNTIKCHCTVDDLRYALHTKLRTGTFPALPGWTYNGAPINTIRISRYGVIEYLDAQGKSFAAWNGEGCFLDD